MSARLDAINAELRGLYAAAFAAWALTPGVGARRAAAGSWEAGFWRAAEAGDPVAWMAIATVEELETAIGGVAERVRRLGADRLFAASGVRL